MEHLGKVYHSKKSNTVTVVNSKGRECPQLKSKRILGRKTSTVYIDKTALYIQLIKLEASGECKYDNRIKVIYKILDDSIDKEMASRKCFNDIRTSISNVIECFGGKENIPPNSIRWGEKPITCLAYK